MQKELEQHGENPPTKSTKNADECSNDKQERRAHTCALVTHDMKAMIFPLEGACE